MIHTTETIEKNINYIDKSLEEIRRLHHLF